jgi:hypothetical protein
LLEKNEKGKYYWKPKYELICDGSKWIVCEKGREGERVMISEEEAYICDGANREWVPREEYRPGEAAV